MPLFSPIIPDCNSKYAYDLKRTPADKALIGIVTSATLLGLYTHFWGRRTVPCEFISPETDPNGVGSECEACQEGMPKRWHCYLGYICPKTRDHNILECTARAGKAFESYFEAHGTLRGCHFMATRPKRQKNSRVEISVKPFDLTKIVLPPALDIPKALCTIWQIPFSSVSLPIDDCPEQTLKIIPEAMDKMRNPAKTGNGRAMK